MKIEVVDVSAERPAGKILTLPEGTRVSEALIRYGGTESAKGKEGWGFGVFGQEVSVDHVLQDGDRLELCPPLAMSPQEVRRRRALERKERKG